MKKKNSLSYYLNLPWTYTIETASHKGKPYYIIRVNELPGICTDAKDLNEGMEEIREAIACAIEVYHERDMPIPEPVDRSLYKGKILYRTDSERHYHIAKTAQRMHKSISKTLDTLIDKGLEKLRTV